MTLRLLDFPYVMRRTGDTEMREFVALSPLSSFPSLPRGSRLVFLFVFFFLLLLLLLFVVWYFLHVGLIALIRFSLVRFFLCSCSLSFSFCVSLRLSSARSLFSNLSSIIFISLSRFSFAIFHLLIPLSFLSGQTSWTFSSFPSDEMIVYFCVRLPFLNQEAD